MSTAQQAEQPSVGAVRPFGQGRGARDEPCRLCGRTDEPLSRTHVMASAAGNDGPARFAVERISADGTPTLDLSRPTQGGGWIRAFCEDCNQRTGRWDEEFILWQNVFFSERERLANRRPGSAVPLIMDALPGAFARCLWAWMFTLDPKLRDAEPAIAEAVRTGGQCAVPESRRLLLALSLERNMWFSGQRDGLEVVIERPSPIWTPAPHSSRTAMLPHAVAAAPPFNVVLSDLGHEHSLPHSDITAWLLDAADARRDVALLLPVVRTERPHVAGPVGYEQILRT